MVDKCKYPGCNNNALILIQLGVRTKDNVVRDGVMRFCKYHSVIIAANIGFHMKSMTIDSKELLVLEGPFDQVKLTESVLGAIQVTQAEKEKKEVKNNVRKVRPNKSSKAN